jgi:glyoxylase-like metal-dependent hydrolase (beta-lactamase superfamily II)
MTTRLSGRPGYQTSISIRPPDKETTQMPAPLLHVGSIIIVPLSDGDGTPVAAEVFPHAPADQWDRVRDYLNPDGTMSINFGSFLIREGDTWTLVDTGFGNRPDTGGGKLMGALADAKVHPDEIGRVIITHLHGDHIGGNTFDQGGKPSWHL